MFYLQWYKVYKYMNMFQDSVEVEWKIRFAH